MIRESYIKHFNCPKYHAYIKYLPLKTILFCSFYNQPFSGYCTVYNSPLTTMLSKQGTKEQNNSQKFKVSFNNFGRYPLQEYVKFR